MPTKEELDALVDTPSKLTQNSLGGLKVQSVVEQVSTFNMLIYGDPGVGKTRLAGSASVVEDLSPVLFVDVEGGTMSLQRTYPLVETVRVNKWDELQTIYNELYRGTHGYKTVVLDSLSEIQEQSMLQIMDELAITGRPSGGEVDIDIPAMREWGKNRTQTRKFVRAYRDLPMNTIFTCLAMDEKDKKTGLSRIMPQLTGKSRQEVPGFIDYVFYMFVKNEQRQLLTTMTDKVVAKTRNETLPTVITDPTMDKLIKLMNGETDEG